MFIVAELVSLIARAGFQWRLCVLSLIIYNEVLGWGPGWKKSKMVTRKVARIVIEKIWRSIYGAYETTV